ncbi:transketolase family protein [Prosthecobacter sp.]|uniref:transketolase family protein n=1 Tax=Prosthecobacter sp. TaxID=1965333 RepID=UPI003783FDEB
MRKQFVTTTERLLDEDERVVVLLGDIGVFAFRNAFKKHPQRIINIGILEQATVSVAAGLAKEGLIPLFHSIAPFVVERAFEQIKVDFGYQQLGGNFVSVGGSYDYAALGCSHHCPGDVSLMQAIPGVEIIAPGHPAELDVLMSQTYASGNPTYYRLSERSNRSAQSVTFGKAEVIHSGKGPTVVTVGPFLDRVVEALEGTDATILYYTTITPFDAATLQQHAGDGRILCVEPFYEGTLAASVTQALRGQRIALSSMGVPRQFLTSYGPASYHDQACALMPADIRARYDELLHV